MIEHSTCQHPDHDCPGLKCGYPLPCPYHTIIVDTTREPTQVTTPITSVQRIPHRILDAIEEIKREKKGDEL